MILRSIIAIAFIVGMHNARSDEIIVSGAHSARSDEWLYFCAGDPVPEWIGIRAQGVTARFGVNSIVLRQEDSIRLWRDEERLAATPGIPVEQNRLSSSMFEVLGAGRQGEPEIIFKPVTFYEESFPGEPPVKKDCEEK